MFVKLHICKEEYFVRSSRNSRGAGRFNICFKFWRTFFSFFLHLSCCNFREHLPCFHLPTTNTTQPTHLHSTSSWNFFNSFKTTSCDCTSILLVLMETTLNLIDFLTCRHHGPSMKVYILPCRISQCSPSTRSACHPCAVLSLFSASVRRRMII